MSLEASKPSSGVRMELLSLKPSPYSRRVVWALKLLGDSFQYQSSQYTSIVGEPGLRWRLGRWNPWVPATVPVAFITSAPDGNGKTTTTILENGAEIVEWANDQIVRTNTSNIDLVPSNLRSEVLRYCDLADDFQNFDRSMFLRALAHDPPSVLRAVVGDDGPPDFVLRYIVGTIIGGFMRTKYRATLNASVSEIKDKAKALESEIAEKQRKKTEAALVYLVGDSLTMADIFMSVALCGGVKDRSKPPTSNEVKQADAIANQGFSMKKECPTLYQWAIDISEKHAVDLTLFVDD